VPDLLHVALGRLDLPGHRVGHAGAAEDHGAHQARDDAAGERGRHQPEAPAQVEGVLAVGARAQHLVLRVEDEEPADGAEDERDERAEEGGEDEVEGEAVLEAGHAEGELRDGDEHEAEAVEGGAGGDEGGRVLAEALLAGEAAVPAGVPEGGGRVGGPDVGADGDVVEDVGGGDEEEHRDQAHLEQRNHLGHGRQCLVVETCCCEL